MNSSRSRDAALRFQERRKREDDAPRLAALAPALTSLRLAVGERRQGSTVPDSKHVRVVVVPRAPALFVFPCADPLCQGGGFDVTDKILREVRDGKQEFVVEDECIGGVGNARCGRILSVNGTATYR